MKVFAGLVVAASATVDRIVTEKWWPANTDAPHCGCQIIIDPAEYGGYINSTCTIRFPYADNVKRYGRADPSDPHFVSIASTYMVGRNRDDFNQKIFGPDAFKFTGFDEVSNPDVLDILVFYDNPDCAREGRSVDEIPTLPQDEIWEVFNVSEAQGKAMCEFALECVPDTQPTGVHLGNFNYDIARSVQTYTAPIYGLSQAQIVTFGIVDYHNQDNDCINPLAHHGHGYASGCSDNVTKTCGNDITFGQNPEHNGLLEYFQFEPVSLATAPDCIRMPEHHNEDYKWETPSPWDTQENYNPTPQRAEDNEEFRNSLPDKE